MANQPESDQFDAGVYELEKTDAVLGGVGGPANAPLINLANRTRYLFNRIQEMLGIAKVYVVSSGTANAITAAYTPAIAALVDGQVVRFKSPLSNTGAVTFTPNATGAPPIAPSPVYGRDHQPLTGGEFAANGQNSLAWNASLNAGAGAWVLVENTGGVQRTVAPGPADNSDAVPSTSWVRTWAASVFASAVQVQNSAFNTTVGSGAVNAYVAAYTPAILAFQDGMVLGFKVPASNTGPATLNVNGAGAFAIVGAAFSALQGSELFVNGIAYVSWSATASKWVLLECQGGELPVAPATQSGHAVTLGQLNSLASDALSKSAGGTVAGATAFTASIAANGGIVSGGVVAVPNNTGISAKSTAGTVYPLTYVDNLNNAQYGNSTLATIINGGTITLTAAPNLNVAASAAAHAARFDQVFGGFGQALTSVIASRAYNVTYTNTTARPRCVYMSCSTPSGGGAVGAFIGGLGEGCLSANAAAGGALGLAFVVPPGASYQVASTGSVSGTLNAWYEY